MSTQPDLLLPKHVFTQISLAGTYNWLAERERVKKEDEAFNHYNRLPNFV